MLEALATRLRQAAPQLLLARRTQRHRAAAPAGTPSRVAEPEARFCSLLDLGAGTIKALVVDRGAEGIDRVPTILAAGAAPAPPSTAGPLSDELLAAAEQALVDAEDRAGIVPRSVVITLSGPEVAIATGRAEVDRPPGLLPIAEQDCESLREEARAAAHAAARRQLFADRLSNDLPPLRLCESQELAWELDQVAVRQPVGRTAARFGVVLAAAFATAGALERASAVAEAMDLELRAVSCQPFSLGAVLARSPLAPALIVEVGAAHTTLTLVTPHGPAGAAGFPLGGRALEARLCSELGLDAATARAALQAHAAGASEYSAAGPGAARIVRRLAEQHADVWLDALELACAELARAHVLPPHLLLCGGGAALPELRAALARRTWAAALPLARPPAVSLLTPDDVPGVAGSAGTLPALQLAPLLAVAARVPGPDTRSPGGS